MELRVFCSFRFIQADESVYDFIFGNLHFLKGKADQLNSNIFTQKMVEDGGQIAMREFCDYPFIYGLFDLENKDELFPITNKFLSRIHQFVNCLWFAKDNSVNAGYLFTHLPENGYTLKNVKQASYSNSQGEYGEVLITKADFELAESIFNKMIAMSKQDASFQMPKLDYSGGRGVASDGDFHYRDYNKNSRIEKAFSFLTMARTSSFLPLKIALCMSLLECLFTTDRQEVTHKVCERVALYLGGTYSEQIVTYKTINEAYDVRSGFFHGQDIDKKRDNRVSLQIISKNVDDLLRVIFKKVILEDEAIFNGTKEERKEHFFKMVFK
jgi:hypothetical protein